MRGTARLANVCRIVRPNETSLTRRAVSDRLLSEPPCTTLPIVGVLAHPTTYRAEWASGSLIVIPVLALCTSQKADGFTMLERNLHILRLGPSDESQWVRLVVHPIGDAQWPSKREHQEKMRRDLQGP